MFCLFCIYNLAKHHSGAQSERGEAFAVGATKKNPRDELIAVNDAVLELRQSFCTHEGRCAASYTKMYAPGNISAAEICGFYSPCCQQLNCALNGIRKPLILPSGLGGIIGKGSE